jgi:hypothetical protein
LLAQVGKAREAEGKNGVGTTNRAQQSYHFERQTFGSTEAALGITLPTQYFTYSFSNIAAGTSSINADATNAVKDGLRQYAGGVGYANGAYSSVVCQGDSVGATVTAKGDGTGCSAGTALR